MGSRLPSGLSGLERAARLGCPACRESRSRQRPRARRARRSSHGSSSNLPKCSSRASIGRTSVTRCRRRPRRADSSCSSSPGHRGEAGIVYCLSRSKTETIAAALKQEGFDALPYHAGLAARDSGCAPAAFPERRCGDHRRDDRVRHGHRQARRALRRASGFAEEHRVVLPGDRPCGPRRRAGRRMDGVRPERRRAAAPARRCVRSRGAAQAPRAAEARCVARLVRSHGVPQAAAARVFRRPAGGRLRQLRQLPLAARHLGRQRSRAQAALGRLPHGAVVRRGPRARRAARPLDRESRAASPSNVVRVRHRRGPRRACVALAAAPAARAGLSAGRARALWRVGADRPCAAAVARRGCDPRA